MKKFFESIFEAAVATGVYIGTAELVINKYNLASDWSNVVCCLVIGGLIFVGLAAARGIIWIAKTGIEGIKNRRHAENHITKAI